MFSFVDDKASAVGNVSFSQCIDLYLFLLMLINKAEMLEMDLPYQITHRTDKLDL